MADRAALNAWWFPPEAPAPDFEVREFGPGRVRLRVAALTPERLFDLLDGLRRAGAGTLAGRPARSVVGTIARAATRLATPGDPFHEEARQVLPGLTGYGPAMIEAGLRRMGEGWTESALWGALAGELEDPGVLEVFRGRRPAGRHRAYGPALTVHVFSGNIPGIAVTSLLRSLCVKSPSFGKTSAGEPYLATCLARALAEVDPDLARCLAVAYWPGGSETLESAAFDAAEVVVAYGGDATIADVRRRLPATTRLLAYPNRVGAGVVLRSALAGPAKADAAAWAAAEDVVTFDQQGCVSPHVLFVERGGAVEPEAFAERVASALAEAALMRPRKAMSAAESSRIHQVRAEAEVRGDRVWASERGTEWTVILEVASGFEPSPLNRVLRIYPVDDRTEALRVLTGVGPHLQTVAVAAAEAEIETLAGALGAAGATRIVPLGRAAWPAPGWHHDGRLPFLDLLRFCDLEE